MSLRNNVNFIGRLVKDIEVRESNGRKFASFTLACNRNKASDGTVTADFVDFVAFEKNAEFASKYFKKGQRVGVTGKLATKMNEREGVKYKTTNVIVESFEFIESTNDSFKKDDTHDMDVQNTENTFQPIDESVSDDDLPF